MKLFKALEIVTQDNEKMIEEIKEALVYRQEDVEMQEPIDDGFFHEKWEEKNEELICIIDELEELEYISDEKEREEKLNSIKTSVYLYQTTYGGLKRLVI